MKQLTIRSLDNFQGVFNYVLVRPGEVNDYIRIDTVGGELRLGIDTSYEPAKHSTTYGYVVQLPSMLTGDLCTDIELELGDRVYFHYLSLYNAVRDNKYVILNGEPHYFVQYGSIYCAVRGDEVIPVNGNILVEEIAQSFVTSSGLVSSVLHKKEHNTKLGLVKYSGVPLRGGRAVCSVGDMILFSRMSDTPLEYHLHRTLGKRMLFRMSYSDVMAVLN